LLNLKTSRPDGDYLGKIHPYRKLMMHIMPTRNESVVYYDTYARVDQLEAYLEAVNKRFHADVTHLLVACIAVAFKQSPSMNRFVVGRRLYQRRSLWLTFSMKREKLNRKAKLSAVKRRIDDNETFYGMCKALNDSIAVERSDKKTYLDKELGLLARVPRPVLRVGVALLKKLDYYGLLPGSFIKNDAMYTSCFIANLGSLGMKAGFHHLYEWGTSPLFAMVGRAEERALVEDGKVVIRKVLPLRFSYDERIDDGLNAGYGIKAAVDTIENPFKMLGCLAADGSDDFPLGAPPDGSGVSQDDALLAKKSLATS
jgi:hypothetical protein